MGIAVMVLEAWLLDGMYRPQVYPVHHISAQHAETLICLRETGGTSRYFLPVAQ